MRPAQEFWNLLAELKRRLSGSWGNDRAYRRLFTGNPGFQRAVYRHFRLSGAAIAMLDLDRRVLLLQSENAGADRDALLTVDLPFVAAPRPAFPLAQGEFSRIVHELFVRRRERQTAVGERTAELEGTLPAAVDQMPEFIRHLPSGFAPPGRADEQDRIYCPAGEIYFHVLLWRWLLWLGAKYGQTNTITDLDFDEAWSAPYVPRSRMIGDKAYWSNGEYDASDGLPETIMTASSGALQRLRKQTDIISERQDGFARDCQLLGIADPSGALTPLGREVLDFPGKARRRTHPVVKDLARVLHAHYGRTVEGKTLSGVLSWLHCTARFPIIPYYYLTVLDGQPKAHLAFPVLRSVAFPLAHAEGEADSPQNSSAMAVALFSLNWRAEPAEEVEQRLREIEVFFRTVSDRMLDQVFYGRFQREEMQRRGAASTLHQLLKDFRVYYRQTEDFAEAWKEYTRHPGGAAPRIPFNDSLAVELMLLEAQDEGRLYEQPEGCRRCLAEEMTAAKVEAEVVDRVVWPQAQARMSSDIALRPFLKVPGVEHVTEKDIARYFGRPRLAIPTPFKVESPYGLFPVMLVALRNAYEHTLRWMIVEGRPNEGHVEIRYSRSGGRQVIEILNSGRAPAKPVRRQPGWLRDHAVLKSIRGVRWKVERSPRGSFSTYDAGKRRWTTRIVG